MPTAIKPIWAKPTLIPGVTREEMQAFIARFGLPRIGGGEQTPEEIAAAEAEAKRLADEEAAEAEKLKLGEAGKETLRKEREARKAAEKAAKDANDRIAALEAKQAEIDEAKRVADEKAAEEQGKFKELAESRATELAAAKAANTETQAKLDALIASLKPGIDAAFKDLPEEVAELFTGDAEDVLGKQAFMATHKKLIDRLAADKESKNKAFENYPKTPRPNGNVPTAGDDKARKDQARTVSTI